MILDVHGDWRSSTRLYGSPARRLLNPLADRVAVSALRHADAVRTISDYTTGLVRSYGVEPAAVFPAFMDLEPFLGPVQPLPSAAAGALRRRARALQGDRGARGRLARRRRAAARRRRCTSSARGRSRAVVEQLVRDLPGRVEWTESLPTEGVAAALDAATVLVLPVALGGDGPRARRGVLPRARRGRRRAWAASSTSSATARTGCSSRRRIRRRWRTRSTACSRIRRSPSGSARARRQSAEAWVASPEEYAARLEALVAGLR